MKNITYISAGAGSGKTYTLTTKLAELISKDKSDPEHVEPEQVILTTFTIKAANEFKEKAKAELYKRGKYDEASRLDKALIGTIDSVAKTLIQKYWFTIGLSPQQGVIDDNAKAMYINQSIANIPTGSDLKFFDHFRETFSIVERYTNKPDYNYWKNDLKEIVEKSISFDITDYTDSVDESLNVLKKLCNGTKITILLDKERTGLLDDLKEVVEACKESDTKTNTLESIESFRKTGADLENLPWWIEFGKILKNKPAEPKGIVLKSEYTDAKQKAADLWLTQDVYDLQEKYINTIFRLADQWNKQYMEYKRNKRIVDFSDMEHYMYELLQDKEVAAEIGRTYTHLFVDEFQDCSPIQVKIFMALADVVKQSYWVGDTKQAIYGFRGSDTQLTKAVADAIAKKDEVDGCKIDKLEESWRSVPSLVDVCNKAFIKIFHPVFGDDTENQVKLESAMKKHPEEFKIKLEDRAKNPLRYLDIKERKSPKAHTVSIEEIAQYVKNVIDKEGVNPSDVAVLGRANTDLNAVQEALSEIGIESDRETLLNISSKACQLMMALTSLVENPYDEIAKAEIAYLTQDNMGVGAIIDSKLEYNQKTAEERGPWMGDVEMIKRVNTLRTSVMYQGIGALMETLAVELDIKNIMERWDIPIEESMTDVKAIINAAKQYENSSSQMALPATPSGFKKYLDENECTLPISGKGVQVMTFHGAKGLQWKYVFMLMDESLSDKDILKDDFYGIHHFHPDEPSADNLYPDMCIRLLPWIFGSHNSYVPDSISVQFFSSTLFDRQRQHSMGESARLLYVAMTRAAEVLVLVPWKYNIKNRFNWFKQMGLSNAGNLDGGDVLGIEIPFKVVHAEFPTEGEETGGSVAGVGKCHILDYHSDTPSNASIRVVAPSGVEGRSENVDVVFRGEEYIKINSGKLGDKKDSDVGDCIHNIYAAIEHLNEEEVRELIRLHGMEEVLPNANEIILAWKKLQAFLEKEIGKPEAVYHERPFRQMREDGTIVVGSIDYVYRTTKGTVLIDFKTFAQGEEVFNNTTSDHYAGLYAGQLNTYAAALKAAGEKVIKKYIYYPVTQSIVEVK